MPYLLPKHFASDAFTSASIQLGVDRFEQFEIWTPRSDNPSRWEMVAAFDDFEVASAVAARRGRRVRLIRSVYDGDKVVEQHVIAEVGDTRQSA